MNRRNSSIELLRVTAILFICLSSSLPYGAMYKGNYSNVYVDLNITDIAWDRLAFTLFRYLGQVGDTVFVMCSSWFLCDSYTAKKEKYIKLILDSFILSLLGLLVSCFFLRPTLSEIIHSVFPITFQNNWFVGCYIIYYLIHPLLNYAVKDLSYKQYRNYLVFFLIAYSIIATIHQSYYFTRLVAFICIHYIVSFSKKYRLNKHNKKYDISIILISCLALCTLIVAVAFVGSQMNRLRNKNLWLCQFYNPIILCAVLPALIMATKKQWQSKVINTVSGLSLLIYLIHGSYFWQAYGKYAILQMMDVAIKSSMGKTIILFLLTTLSSILLALFYKATLGRVTSFLANKDWHFKIKKIV